MKNAYADQLGIWVVGVRQKKRNGSLWGELWKPTSLKWFSTRKDCAEFISKDIPEVNLDVYEYKPLRYVPKTKP